jgi:hypothetical protein
MFLHNYRYLSAQRKKITKNITQAGGVGNQHLSLALSVFL